MRSKPESLYNKAQENNVPGTVADVSNFNTWEAETKRLLSQKQNKTKNIGIFLRVLFGNVIDD